MTCIYTSGCTNRVEQIELGLTQGRLAGHKLKVCLNHQLTYARKLSKKTADGNEPTRYFFPQAASRAETAVLRPAFSDMHLLFMILQDADLFEKAMRDFCDETDASWDLAHHGNDDYVLPLSSTLSAYEGLCWFSPQKRMMAGLLSEIEFHDTIRSGYMVKDPGPGVRHGEFSHRLQWHYIMRVMTDSFTANKTRAWFHTPLELYSKVGGVGRHRGVWGTILEGGSSLAAAAPSDPVWVNAKFLPVGSIEGMNARAGAGTLQPTQFGRAMSRRFGRRRERLDELTRFAETDADIRLRLGAPADFAGIAEIVELNDSTQRRRRQGANKVCTELAMGYIFNWENAGMPDDLWEIATAADWIERFAAFERLHILTQVHENPGDKWTKQPELELRLAFFYAKKVLFADGIGELDYVHTSATDLVLDGLLLHGEDQDGYRREPSLDARIGASQQGLNPAYVFDDEWGARSLNDAPVGALI